MNCIIMLQGGHTTFLRGISNHEVEQYVTEARAEGHEFCYLQPTNFEDNGVAVDPKQVVAVISAGAKLSGESSSV